MGLLITISAGTSQTDILSGRKPRTKVRPSNHLIVAGQIDFWDDQKLVLSGSPGTPNFTSILGWPFTQGAANGGDCLFDTGSLFCFAGRPNRSFDDVMMVLRNFPLKAQEDDTGVGQLNSPPTSGLLAGGPISWVIWDVM